MGIILKSLRKKTMEAFQKEIVSSNNYFVFLGKNDTAWTNELIPDKETEAIRPSTVDTRTNMLIGKKIQSDDLAFMARRFNWSYGNTYTSYSDIDPNIYANTNVFYVLNSRKDVFKCINSPGSNSEIEPTSVSLVPFTLSDGYTWKYMFTVSDLNDFRFGTTDYFPINFNSSVINSAVAGSIDSISIVSPGSGYAHANGYIQEHISGNTIFRIDTSVTIPIINVTKGPFIDRPSSGLEGDVYVIANNDVNPLMNGKAYIFDGLIWLDFASSNLSALDENFANGYFDNCSLYIQAGTGAGTLSVIDKYIANSSGRFVELKTPLDNIDLTSRYLISPTVTFTGSSNTIATAYTTIDEFGGISSVNILNGGSGYQFANIEISGAFGSGATLSASVAPYNGHGSDPVVELGSDKLCISVDISNNEFNTVNTAISFRQVGIIQDLRYQNTTPYLNDTFDLTINTNNIERYSGEVLYYDNVTVAPRSNNTTETVRLIIKF